MEKNCLVTVGATVGFPDLTRAALEPAFWGHLASRGFTSLRIQCGPDIDWATSDLASKRHLSKEGYAIHSSTKLDHLKEAVDKIDLLREENQTRWPPHSPERGATEQPVSIWNIEVVEAHKEEASQLAQG
ncbi:uncharacterized protein J7T54_006499 [Emericellopsis cladophorae]|uniref:Uncharacterized protein n=1 Tax=Emericellopsis cladophorae TaxID=2686198 RepID=A0A9P9Y7X4_9HYPO|nr:uncharacterized protein J7T54_006499 [Emericellopsis cladophorae]KAI6784454.1 hypothetical protein J7T54_006499 [Emericellopsis cladophorae]